MKKALITICLFSLFPVCCLCQQLTRLDTIEIHQNIVKSLKTQSKKILILPYTKKSGISSFDFNNPSGIDTAGNRIWKQEAWKVFLNHIDTATVSDYELTTRGKPWFKNQGVTKDKYAYTFTPVIFSKAGDKAICITTSKFTSSSSGGSIAWFLEKNNDKWQIKEVKNFMFND